LPIAKRLALDVAGGFRLGFARVDGGGVLIILLSERSRRRLFIF
jgi:hypothetical protein